MASITIGLYCYLHKVKVIKVSKISYDYNPLLSQEENTQKYKENCRKEMSKILEITLSEANLKNFL